MTELAALGLNIRIFSISALFTGQGFRIPDLVNAFFLPGRRQAAGFKGLVQEVHGLFQQLALAFVFTGSASSYQGPQRFSSATFLC